MITDFDGLSTFTIKLKNVENSTQSGWKTVDRHANNNEVGVDASKA
jgi:hypothetical protein